MEDRLLGQAGWHPVTVEMPAMFEDLSEDVQKTYINSAHVDMMYDPMLETTLVEQAFWWKVRAFLSATQHFKLRLSYPIVGLAWKTFIVEEEPAKVLFRFHNSEEKSENLSQPTKFLVEELTSSVPDVNFVLRLIGDLVDVARRINFSLTYAPRLYEELRYTFSNDKYGDIAYEAISLQQLWPFLLVEPELQTPTPCSELLVSFCESFDGVYVPDKMRGVTPAFYVQMSDYDLNRPETVHDNNLLIERLLDANLDGFNSILGYRATAPVVFSSREDLAILAGLWLKPTHAHYEALTSPEPNAIQEDWMRCGTFIAKLLVEHGARAFAIIARVKSDDGFFLFPEFEPYPLCRMAIAMLEFKW